MAVNTVVIGCIKECIKTMVDRQRIHLLDTGKVISRRNSINDNDTKTVATVGLSCYAIQFIIIPVIGLVTEYIHIESN